MLQRPFGSNTEGRSKGRVALGVEMLRIRRENKGTVYACSTQPTTYGKTAPTPAAVFCATAAGATSSTCPQDDQALIMLTYRP